ncbi:MAG: globin domain-containing protein [Gammaproteobacteria bacterium]
MNIANRLLVKNCIEAMEQDGEKLSRLFYRELFHLDIRLKTVFPGNVVFLNRKFFNMLATLKNVKHLESISETITKMGERHIVRYGVQTEHFATLKQALLLALAAHLGPRFTPELQEAWREVVDEVSAIMIQAMNNIDRRQQHLANHAEKDDDALLLEEIGGEETVAQIHRRFYDILFDHPWLGQFFYGKSKAALIKKQTRFMVAAFGGPNHYSGDTPAFVHMHMFITDEMADLRERILKQCILAEGLSEEVANRWLKVDQSFRPGIVKQSIDECVLKCPGQFPVTAKKPAYLK